MEELSLSNKLSKIDDDGFELEDLQADDSSVGDRTENILFSNKFSGIQLKDLFGINVPRAKNHRESVEISAKDLLKKEVPAGLVKVVFDNLFKNYNVLRLCESDKSALTSKSEPILTLFSHIYDYFNLNLRVRDMSLNTKLSFTQTSIWDENSITFSGRPDICLGKILEDKWCPFLIVECKAQSVDQAIDQLTSYLIYARDKLIAAKSKQPVYGFCYDGTSLIFVKLNEQQINISTPFSFLFGDMKRPESNRENLNQWRDKCFKKWINCSRDLIIRIIYNIVYHNFLPTNESSTDPGNDGVLKRSIEEHDDISKKPKNE